MTGLERFQEHLRVLFQIDTADLDFGIYKILNYKREYIHKFIEEGISEIVDQAFARYCGERMEEIGHRLEEVKQKVIDGLGPDAFLPSDEIRKKYENMPLGKDYLGIKERKDDADATDRSGSHWEESEKIRRIRFIRGPSPFHTGGKIA